MPLWILLSVLLLLCLWLLGTSGTSCQWGGGDLDPAPLQLLPAVFQPTQSISDIQRLYQQLQSMGFIANTDPLALKAALYVHCPDQIRLLFADANGLWWEAVFDSVGVLQSSWPPRSLQLVARIPEGLVFALQRNLELRVDVRQGRVTIGPAGISGVLESYPLLATL